MNPVRLTDLPDWTTVLILMVHFAVGVALGAVHFRGLWWNSRLFAGNAHLTTTIGLLIGRFVLLAGMLTLASLEGAMPLLTMALGILVARSAVIYRIKRLPS